MAETLIFAEQTLTFESVDGGLYLWQTIPSAASLTEGEEYTVVWDGTQYKCTAIAANFNGVDGLGIGNFALAGLGEDTKEPFLFGSAIDGSFSACYTTENDAANKLAIYQVAEDETPEGIVLKDRNGNDVAYYGIETVTFDTTTEGKQQTFTKGVAVEGLEIVPDFSGGDMLVAAAAGTLVKSAVIRKPDALVPENIAEGVDIAGIVGMLKADDCKIASGNFRGTGIAYTLTHGLGAVPDLVIVWTNVSTNGTLCRVVGFSSKLIALTGFTIGQFFLCGENPNSGTEITYIECTLQNMALHDANEQTVVVGGSSGITGYTDINRNYQWLAISGII